MASGKSAYRRLIIGMMKALHSRYVAAGEASRVWRNDRKAYHRWRSGVWSSGTKPMTYDP